jgi:hypothetical protein
MKPDSYNKGAIERSVARQRLSKHSIIPERSLSNGCTKNGGTVGSGVFHADRAETTKGINFEL